MKKETVLSALLKTFGYVALFFACQMAASLLAEVLIFFQIPLGLSWEESQELVLSALRQRMYEIMLLSELIFFGVVGVMFRARALEKTGIQKSGALPLFSGATLGFGLYVCASFLISIASLIPLYRQSLEKYIAEQEAITAAEPNLFLEILCVSLVGPIAEEILCRGLIQKTLLRAMHPAFAIGVSSLLFSLIHGNLYQIVFTLPLGIVLGLLAWRFDSVLPAILLHATFNGSNFLIQMGSYLGYEETSALYNGIVLAVYGFFCLCIPVGLVFLEFARRKHPSVPAARAAFSDATKEESAASAFPLPNAPFSEKREILLAATDTTTEGQGETMAAPEWIVVGLGNPEDKYAATRHNAGFIALDYIAIREKISMDRLRFRAKTGEGVINGQKILFLKPQTYMNLSGQAVAEAAAFYKIPPERILVIYDDVNFQPGSFRIRKEGSAGGHNGIKSIISCLGTEAFPRVKIGVGQPPQGWDMMHWVLGNFSPEEQKKIVACMEDVFSTVRFFTIGELDQAMQNFNGKIR